MRDVVTRKPTPRHDLIPEEVIQPPESTGSSTKISESRVETNYFTGSHTVKNTVKVNRNPPSFSSGVQTKGSWNTVSQDTDLKPGDIVRFTYRMGIRLFQQWQANRILSDLQEDGRFQVRYFALSTDEGRLWVEVKILKPGSPAIIWALAVGSILVAASIWVSTESIERLTTIESPLGTLNLFPLIAIGVTAIVLFGAIKSA